MTKQGLVTLVDMSLRVFISIFLTLFLVLSVFRVGFVLASLNTDYVEIGVDYTPPPPPLVGLNTDYIKVEINFTPPPIIVRPSVTTNAATNVQSDQATLNGNLTDMGGDSSCSVWFDWGTSPGSYPNPTIPQTKTTTGTFSATIAGLSFKTTYYFRAVAQNSADVSYGSEQSFTTLPTPVSEYDVWGWAWSDNIGWVSFNCSDRNYCPTSNYGVRIDSTTGEMFGYAWSDHIGWISFNASNLAGCPIGPCEAKVDLETGYVSGWAKALVDGGGWSGWLRLKDSNHGVWIDAEPDPAEFMNYSWSDLNIGWLSFNCRNQDRCGTSNYKVMTSLVFEPEVPTPNVSNPRDSFDDPCGQSRIPTLSWDTDATRPYDYEIEMDDDPNFGSPNVTDLVSSTSNTFWMSVCSYCCNVSPYNTINWGGQTYYWHIRARNAGGEWSSWASDTFITKAHCYPYPDFLCNGVNCPTVDISEKDVVTLSDNSSYYNGRNRCQWGLPDGAIVISGNINSDCVLEVQFVRGESQPISLDVFDSAGYSCSCDKTVTVSRALSLPEWKEIKP